MSKKSIKAIKIVSIILAVVLCIGGAGTAVYNHKSVPASVNPYNGTAQYISTKGKAMTSAHRSGGDVAPEESMMAFKNCVESNDFQTDIFEFDLHITSDGVLVLLHDDTLDRTSDCEKVFGETDVLPETKTYEQLRQLNMAAKFVDENGSKPFENLSGDAVPADVRIQRVEDVLDYLTANGDYKFIIEIKNGGDLGRQGVDKLCEILKERNLFDRVIFGTFKGEITDYVDSDHPELKRSASIKEVVQFYFGSFVNAKIKPKYIALQIPYRLYGFNLGTAKIINYAHSMDLATQYWTINDEEDVKYLNSIGADCIMSDDPGMAYRAINGDQSTQKSKV